MDSFPAAAARRYTALHHFETADGRSKTLIRGRNYRRAAAFPNRQSCMWHLSLLMHLPVDSTSNRISTAQVRGLVRLLQLAAATRTKVKRAKQRGKELRRLDGGPSSQVHKNSMSAYSQRELNELAEHLKAIICNHISDANAKQLLMGANFDVERAVNHYFENPTQFESLPPQNQDPIEIIDGDEDNAAVHDNRRAPMTAISAKLPTKTSASTYMAAPPAHIYRLKLDPITVGAYATAKGPRPFTSDSLLDVWVDAKCTGKTVRKRGRQVSSTSSLVVRLGKKQGSNRLEVCIEY